MVTFSNCLKGDTVQTIETLSNAGIKTKMITGDQIFLGIKTAFMAGIISSGKKVIVLIGSRIEHNSG